MKETLSEHISLLSKQLDTVRKAVGVLKLSNMVRRLLKNLYAKFNDGKWKENQSTNDIKLIVDRLEALLPERKRRLSNLDNKQSFGKENRLFEYPGPPSTET